MGRHAEIMEALMGSRARRGVRREIQKMRVEELRNELRKRNASEVGEVDVLKDRLLRALLREIEPENQLIPWYDWDNVGTETGHDRGFESTGEQSNVEPIKTGKKRGRKPKQVVADKRVEETELVRDSDSNRGSNLEINRREEVQVEVHTSSSPVVVVTTTATTPTVITTSGGSSRGTREPDRLVMTADSPRMTSGFIGGQWPILHPGIVEFMAAQYIREMKVGQGSQAGVRMTPANPTHSAVNKKSQWFTPSQDFDSIQRVSSSESEEESGEDGELSEAQLSNYEKLTDNLSERNGSRSDNQLPRSHHDLAEELRDVVSEEEARKRRERERVDQEQREAHQLPSEIRERER